LLKVALNTITLTHYNIIKFTIAENWWSHMIVARESHSWLTLLLMITGTDKTCIQKIIIAFKVSFQCRLSLLVFAAYFLIHISFQCWLSLLVFAAYYLIHGLSEKCMTYGHRDFLG
jgi:hypothetical protein